MPLSRSTPTSPGSIIGSLEIAAAHTYSLTTVAAGAALVVVDSTNARLQFTAPSSGIVDIDLSMFTQMTLTGSTGAQLTFGWLVHGTGATFGEVVSGLTYNAGSGSTVFDMFSNTFHLVGLTPGAAIDIDLAAAAVTGAGSVAGSIVTAAKTVGVALVLAGGLPLNARVMAR